METISTKYGTQTQEFNYVKAQTNQSTGMICTRENKKPKFWTF
jgi:hypothetical protein